MENNGEEMPHMKKHKYNNSVKMDIKNMKHINNLNNIENKCKKKNGMNGTNFYSKKNNSVVKKNGNINNNVTNNVCIIINSPKQKEFEENSYNNYNIENASFSKMNGNNKIKTKNDSINTKKINFNNNYQKENLNINGCLINNSNDVNQKRNYIYNIQNEKREDKNENHLNNEEKDNEYLLKINNEINFIKKILALKLEEENKMGLTIQTHRMQKDAITQTEQTDNNSPKLTEEKNIKNNNRNIINYNTCKTETSIEDVITPTFKQKANAGKKDKANQSLRSILY
jgi:hypothetical protein